MPRLSNTLKRDGLQALKARVQRIVESPLQEIGLLFLSAITDLEYVAGAEAGDAKLNLPALIKDLEGLLEHLPSSFSDRFMFDTGMVQAIVEELNNSSVHLNRMILPRLGKAWAHGTLPLPWIKGGEQRFVHFIFFQGEDDLNDVTLLSYPFLIHEIGHNLLSRHDSILCESFKADLNKVTNRLRLSAIADTGAERTKSQRGIEDIRKFWLPTSDHKNWMHELAIDLIALWICGPAYLAAFQDEMEKPEANPYQVTQDHPPNAVRAATLIDVGRRLGWGEYTYGLSELLEKWRQSQREALDADYNQYLALTAPTIVAACVSATLATCEELGLPKCTTETVGRVRDILARNETPDFGVELIVAAWLVLHEKGEEAYLQWGPQVVRDLLRYITL